MNIFFMKASKFIKMLRHAGVIGSEENLALHNFEKTQSNNYLNKSCHLRSHPYTNTGIKGEEMDLTDSSEELDIVPESKAYKTKQFLSNTFNNSFNKHSNGRKSMQTEFERKKLDFYTNKACQEFQSRIKLSEYNNESANIESSEEFMEGKKINEIEVDLLLQYLVTPFIPETQKKSNALEVVSVMNHKRNFLVNPEEKKEQYKFGKANKRSTFLPQECEGEEQFYINFLSKDSK